jgi:hypothetical protein
VLVEVAENMKIILPTCREKQAPLLIKIAFFRGKMKKHCAGNWRGRLQRARVIWRETGRDPESAARNVTKLLNSVHTLFTPEGSLARCQRREIRNAEKNRQAKI